MLYLCTFCLAAHVNRFYTKLRYQRNIAAITRAAWHLASPHQSVKRVTMRYTLQSHSPQTALRPASPSFQCQTDQFPLHLSTSTSVPVTPYHYVCILGLPHRASKIERHLKFLSLTSSHFSSLLHPQFIHPLLYSLSFPSFPRFHSCPIQCLNSTLGSTISPPSSSAKIEFGAFICIFVCIYHQLIVILVAFVRNWQPADNNVLLLI